jgi:hypothetical protein
MPTWQRAILLQNLGTILVNLYADSPVDPLMARKNILCPIYIHLFVTVPCLEGDRWGGHTFELLLTGT